MINAGVDFKWDADNRQTLSIKPITTPVNKKQDAFFVMDADCNLICNTEENIQWPIDAGPLDMTLVRGNFNINTSHDFIFGGAPPSNTIIINADASLNIQCSNVSHAGNDLVFIYNISKVNLKANNSFNMNSVIGGDPSVRGNLTIQSPCIDGTYQISDADLVIGNGFGSTSIYGNFAIGNSSVYLTSLTVALGAQIHLNSGAKFICNTGESGKSYDFNFLPGAQFKIDDNSFISFDPSDDDGESSLDFTTASLVEKLFNFQSKFPGNFHGGRNGYSIRIYGKKGVDAHDQFNALLDRGFLAINDVIVKDASQFHTAFLDNDIFWIGLTGSATNSAEGQHLEFAQRARALLKSRKSGALK